MGKPANFAGFILYRIYYEDRIVYIGRTMQPLQNRIRGHLFKRPLHREIDIDKVTRIEYAILPSQADMYLYEIYFINLWKPALNKDDKAADDLTITLPEVEWKKFTTPLWRKWQFIIHENDIRYRNEKELKIQHFELQKEMRAKFRNGEISRIEYEKFIETLFANNEGNIF